MAQVTEQLIREYYSDTFFKRGKKYYRSGSVQNLRYDSEENIWSAYVKGSQTYRTRVRVDEDSLADFCNCPAYPTYGGCKHICATLLAIADAQQQDLNFPRKNTGVPSDKGTRNTRYRQAEALINIFAGDPAASFNKRLLKIEFHLRTYVEESFPRGKEVFDIQLKVGEKRLYIVKDIREFLDCVANNQVMTFGKHFTFDPDLHNFSEKDEEALDKLIEIRETEAFYDNNSSYPVPFRNKRGLLIPTYAADDLLLKLQHLKCQYEQQFFVYDQLELGTEDLPFSFSLESGSANEYQLKVTGGEYGQYFNSYGWYGEDGKLYKLSKQQRQCLEPFTEYMGNKEKSGLPISTEQVGAFISKTLPKIKQIGEVAVSEKVSEVVVNPPLKIKVFVDGTDERVDVDLEYHYDSIVINPLNESEKDSESNEKILIRDNEKEQEFMTALEDSPLKVRNNQLYADTEEDLFELLYETLPALEELSEIYLTSSVKSMILPSAPKAAVEVKAPSEGHFLEVDFTMDGIDPEEISRILQSVKEKRRYVRLPDGSFLSLLDEELGELADLHQNLTDKATENADGTMELPLYRGLQIEEQMSNLDSRSRKFSKNFRKFFNSIKTPEEEEVQIPPALKADLREYQETGFKWLKSLSKYGLGGVLADDMGLGKTVQCIAYTLSEIEDGADKPFLVVAPASLVYNWKNEFHQFAPNLRADVATGTVKERKAILEQEETPNVYITSYHTLRQDLDWYSAQTFHSLILDEAQAIKNYKTKIAQAVRTITASRRFALSGTPVENSLDELWAFFQAVMPGFLYDQKTFRSTPPETIARLVRPFILRRVKEDVLTELPDKIETTHYSEMNKDQKKLYLAYLDKIQKETNESLATDGMNKGRLKILAGLTRLRQLCCHPSLFVDQYEGDSGKLEALFEIIGNAQSNGQRMLVFSQFPSMLKIIQEKLAQSGQSCYYLDGQTPSAERVRLVESFNQGDEGIFLISLKAGGTGLNLTGADTVVLYDLWWNPAVEEQAIGRAHRMGQKNVVQVIRMIAQGTIEEKINGLQQQKKEMIDQIIQPGEAQLASLSEDDIREILSI